MFAGFHVSLRRFEAAHDLAFVLEGLYPDRRGVIARLLLRFPFVKKDVLRMTVKASGENRVRFVED